MGTAEFDLCLLPDCIGWEYGSLMHVVLGTYGYRETNESLADRFLLNHLLQRPTAFIHNLNSLTENIEPGNYAALARNPYSPDGSPPKWRSHLY